jgi:hypothetical protein
MFLLIVITKRINMIKNIEGIKYEAVVKGEDSCDGCAFNNGHCTLDDIKNLDFTTMNYCGDIGTIWIKHEVKVKEQPKEIMKDTTVNKGVKHDQEKERYDLIPVLALEAVAKVLTAGAIKYNEDYEQENWRYVPNATRRYLSATQRHIAWVRKGQKIDSESGVHHYAHAIASLMFLLEKELEDNAKVDMMSSMQQTLKDKFC